MKHARFAPLPDHCKPSGWLAAGLLLGCLTSATAQTPAFPGALGFGAYATGGRTGTVYHVTTLADSGAGSFRDAVSGANRIVVFDVGGYITLKTAVSVNKNITIAGQSAPGGGIGFKGGEISFANRSNIICRFIRIRPGSDTASHTDDCLSLYRAQNVICDHVSLEFGPWNNVGAVSDDWQNYPVTSVTFQNCLNANPSRYVAADSEPGQQFGAHTESVASTMSWFYTLFANSHNRNPLSKINDVFVNNVLYNCSAGYTTHTSTPFDHDIVNNYFIAGPASGGNLPWYQIDINQSIYYSGNLYDSDSDGVLDGSLTTPYWYQGEGTVLTSPWSPLTPTLPIHSATAAYRITVSQAGALPRDQVDDLVLSQVKRLGSGTVGTGVGTAGPDGGLYNSQINTGLGNNGYGVINGGVGPIDTDQDGMPDYWEKAVGLNPNSSGDTMTIGADGYANLERYLNWLAEPRAFAVTNTSVDVDLWQWTSGFTNASPVYTLSGVSNGAVSLTNGHLAHFVPTPDFTGLGGFQFSVTASDGTGYTNAVVVVVSPQVPPSNLIWRGDGAANLWAVDSGSNWLKGGEPATFTSGDNVTFDDSGSNSPAIVLSGSISAGTVSVVAEQDYTFAGGGLVGPTALFKVGAGKLTLNTLNTFAGSTIINEGIVQLGDGVSTNGSLGGNVTNRDTLIFANPTAVSSAASIHGTGVLIKRGAGTLTQSGAHTYLGLTTIEEGTLELTGTPSLSAITNNGLLTFKPAGALTHAGAITGPGRVNTSSSSITVTLSGANSFSGGLTVTSGNLGLSHSRAAGTGPVTNTSTGLIYLGSGVVITNDHVLTTSTVDLGMRCDSGTGTWAGNVTVLGGASWRPGSAGSGVFVFTGTAHQGTHNFIVPRGTVHLAANAAVSASGSATALGRDTSGTRGLEIFLRDNSALTLGACSIGGGQAGSNVVVTLQNNAALTLTTNTLDLHNINRAASVSTLRLNGGTLTVPGFTKTRSYTNVINFNGGVLLASSNNPSGFLPAFTLQTATVQAGGARIDDGGFALGIAAPLLHEPALGTFADGGLAKLGAGTLTLSGACTFTGPTLVQAGTLALSGAGSIAGSTGLYLAAAAAFDASSVGGFSLGSGRTLWGNGSVTGLFAVGAGAALAPGSNSIGRLAFSSSLVLGAFSTNRFEISKASLTNDSVTVAATLTCGGTLIVSRADAAPLAPGDRFKLFNAGAISGAFSSVQLPATGSGLAWDTGALYASGLISVVAAPPVITHAGAQGTNLVLAGTNGPASGSYYVLTSTNLIEPLGNWARRQTNQFDASGAFTATNGIDAGEPQRYFQLQLP